MIVALNGAQNGKTKRHRKDNLMSYVKEAFFYNNFGTFIVYIFSSNQMKIIGQKTSKNTFFLNQETYWLFYLISPSSKSTSI